jgi:hypothetical protein
MMKSKDLTPAQRNALKKIAALKKVAELNARQKPSSKPMGSDKKKPGATKVTPNRRGLPKETPKKLLPKQYGIGAPRQTPLKPIPSGPRKPKTTAKPAPTGPKKKPTLDDFLTKGKKPPMKIKPGLTRPSDADVIIKGYNDKNTIKKYKKGK